MNKTITTLLSLALVAAPTFANDLSGQKGFCSVLMCSSKRGAELEVQTTRLRGKHPENTAVRELSIRLHGKAGKTQSVEAARFFAVTDSMDATALEKAIERRLNDGQSDKLSNGEVQKLSDVLTGAKE